VNLKSKIQLPGALIALAGFLLIAALSDCSKHQSSGGLARLKPCRLPGIDEKLLCGQLTVFENRQTHVGRTIELNVVVLPAFDQKTKQNRYSISRAGPVRPQPKVCRFMRSKARNIVAAAT